MSAGFLNFFFTPCKTRIIVKRVSQCMLTVFFCLPAQPGIVGVCVFFTLIFFCHRALKHAYYYVRCAARASGRITKQLFSNYSVVFTTCMYSVCVRFGWRTKCVYTQNRVEICYLYVLLLFQKKKKWFF